MGRMGITNTIMLLQAIFLYTFSSDASLNAVNKISFYVDIVYCIALCLWLLLTGYRCVTSILCNLMQRRSDDLNPVDSDVTIRRCHLLQDTAPLDCGVEEESPNLNIPAGNVLTHNNLFIRFPNDVNPHEQCQELNEKFYVHQNIPCEPRLFYQQSPCIPMKLVSVSYLAQYNLSVCVYVFKISCIINVNFENVSHTYYVMYINDVSSILGYL